MDWFLYDRDLTPIMKDLNVKKSFCINQTSPLRKKCLNTHCVKSDQIRSYFWSVFSCIRTEYAYSVPTQENTDQK